MHLQHLYYLQVLALNLVPLVHHFDLEILWHLEHLYFRQPLVVLMLLQVL